MLIYQPEVLAYQKVKFAFKRELKSKNTSLIATQIKALIR